MAQVALVTGANRGIGLAIAKILIDQGIITFVASRKIEAAKNAIEQEFLNNNLAKPIQLDVTVDEDITKAVEEINNCYGRLDLLVNNSGITHSTNENTTPRSNFTEVLDVNVIGAVAMIDAFTLLLGKSQRKKGGLILNVSSIFGSINFCTNGTAQPSTMIFPYMCSKAALNMMTAAYSQYLKDKNIRILSVCPGRTASSDFNKKKGARSCEESATILLGLLDEDKDYPTGTFWGTPSDQGLIPYEW
ncbi:hypothetical protein VKS41_007181 [Umbelopsis sp. WA50703]